MVTIDFTNTSPATTTPEAQAAFDKWIRSLSVWFEANAAGNPIGKPDTTEVEAAYWRQEEFWVDRSGVIILIRDMSNKHLEFTLRYLERMSFHLMLRDHMRLWGSLFAPRGLHAQDAVEHFQDEECERELNEPGSFVKEQRLYRAIREELRSRG